MFKNICFMLETLSHVLLNMSHPNTNPKVRNLMDTAKNTKRVELHIAQV